MVRRESVIGMSVGLAVLCIATVLLGGCLGAAEKGERPAGLSEKQVVASASPDSVLTMPVEERRSLIASDFPAEVPVPKGVLESGRSQQAAWDYVVKVDTNPDALLEWYRTNLELRSWVTVAARIDEQTDERILEMRKVAAETRMVINTDPATGMARAQVVVGVGVPVLETR